MSTDNSVQTKSIRSQLAKIAGQLLVFVLVFSALSVALDWWRGQNLQSRPASIANLSDVHGRAIELTDELQIIYFWASWCGPCKVTTPSIQRLSRHYPVTSIAMASGSDSELKQYLNDKKLSFTVINDNEQQLSKAWGVGVTPSILFVKNGELVHQTSGASSYPGLLLRSWLVEYFY
ncbi:protein disulfide oxidoreductase [Agaribacterium haliotis]|uniref:protein disulfide oxidoreductase n=1 Tax=Agaribacterium haliotis TaxID=2013869 RepID=UPI000BB56CF0|nr:protein disulfide oxidoreductase [Agaribacterium haliotis]